MSQTILIAEDEDVLRESIAELLTDEGYRVLQAPNGKVARETVLAEPVDLVISDIRMPEMDGMELLKHLKQLAPETPVIMLTAYGTVQNAVATMRAGACDYVLKPVEFNGLLLKVQRAQQQREMTRTRRFMTEQLSADSGFHSLIGRSPPMLRLFEMVRKLSGVRSNVLLTGESGTGKELFARAIHYNGLTREMPFVPVNCGAIPDNLVASELFGHRKGAFTSADRDRTGYFEVADGGTLFLDEISTFPMPVQSSLLRALEERVIIPVGDTRPREVDVRIVAASNQDLEKMIAAGEFREDLFYRLNVVRLEVPPLRSRKEDIPMLVHHFLDKHARAMNKQVTGVSNGAMRAMLNHEWRGNVRELENVIERAVIFVESNQITVAELPFAEEGMTDDVGEALKDALGQFERQHIIASLRRYDYDKGETSRRLGIGVSSLYRKMDELGIPTDLASTDGEKVSGP